MKKLVQESLEEFKLYEAELLKGQIEPAVNYDDVDKKEFLLGMSIEKSHTTNIAAQKLLVLQNLGNDPKFYSENMKKGVYNDPHSINIYKKYFIDKEEVTSDAEK